MGHLGCIDIPSDRRGFGTSDEGGVLFGKLLYWFQCGDATEQTLFELVAKKPEDVGGLATSSRTQKENHVLARDSTLCLICLIDQSLQL